MADQQTAAYFEGAAKAQKFIGDAPVVASAAGRAPAGAVPEGLGDAVPVASIGPGGAPPAVAAPAGASAAVFPEGAVPLAPPEGAVPLPPPVVADVAPAAPQAAPGDVPEVADVPAAIPEAPEIPEVPLNPAPEVVGVATVPGDADTAAAVVTPAPPPAVVLPVRFDVVGQRSKDRADGLATYYIVIDPIDRGSDGFKAAVKQVIAALAAANGGPMFSAMIFDRLPAAQTEVSFRSNSDLFSTEMLDAREAANSQHLVADYVGGVAAVNELAAYQLFWFPETRYDAPGVGQWVSAETWKP